MSSLHISWYTEPSSGLHILYIMCCICLFPVDSWMRSSPIQVLTRWVFRTWPLSLVQTFCVLKWRTLWQSWKVFHLSVLQIFLQDRSLCVQISPLRLGQIRLYKLLHVVCKTVSVIGQHLCTEGPMLNTSCQMPIEVQSRCDLTFGKRQLSIFLNKCRVSSDLYQKKSTPLCLSK